MKSKVLVLGMVTILLMSMFVLTGCSTVEENTDNTSNNTEIVEEAMIDCTFKDLSFKLPQSYTEKEDANDDTVIYNTDVVDGKIKLFSVATIDSNGVDFIETATTSLADYNFELSGYDLISKGEAKLGEINGVKTISVDVKYHNDTVNGDAEVEYCYAQKEDTVYVICFEIFTQNGKEIKDGEFEETFKDIRASLKLV